MKQSRQHLPVILFACLLILVGLACGPFTSGNIDQVQQAAATAQAQAELLAPTLQAGAGGARTAAATAAAKAGTAAAQAVKSAPTVQQQAGDAAIQIATIAAGANSGGADIIATVDASDLDLSQLQALFENVQLENGAFTVTITEAQLNQAIQLQQTLGATQGQSLLVQDLRFTLADGAIILRGNVTQPVQGPLIVSVAPYVDNGVKFEVVQATIGSITLPAAIVDGVEDALNLALEQSLGRLPKGVSVTGVTVASGALTISGGQE